MEIFEKYVTGTGGVSIKHYKKILHIFATKQSVFTKSLFLRILKVSDPLIIEKMEKVGLTQIITDWYQECVSQRDVYFLQLLLDVFSLLPSTRSLYDNVKLLSNLENPGWFYSTFIIYLNLIYFRSYKVGISVGSQMVSWK